MSNTPTTFVGKLIAAAVSIFHKAVPLVDEIVKDANIFVNEFKIIEASQAGQFLEATIETLIPASTGLINAAKLWLPKIAGLITNIGAEVDKSDEEKVADLVNYLNGLKLSDSVLYAGVLNTINAAYQQFRSTNQGVVLPVSQSLSIAPIVHDPNLGTVA
jgi:hypothetical protein